MPLSDAAIPPSPPPFAPSLLLTPVPSHRDGTDLNGGCTPPATTAMKGSRRGTKRGMDVDEPDRSSSKLSMTLESRQFVPMKSSKRRCRTALVSSPTQGSRETSPVAEASSPIKRARTSSLSGEIRGFHFLSSDDESDAEGSSPTIRSRTRFNQLLGPSPLQKSFSSTAVSQVPKRMTFERAATTPPTPGEIIKTRAKALLGKEEVENLGTELNKVFALVHGKGLGMGSTGGARGRRGSALRPKDGRPDEGEKKARWSRMDVDDDED